jgi:tetratricopeptide (TPR) repeat protein
MNRLALLVSTLLLAGAWALAQQPPDPSTSNPSPGNQGSGNQGSGNQNSASPSSPSQDSKNQDSASPSSARKDSAAQPASDHKSDQNSDDQESSSHDTRIDTSPPKDDAKKHPNSQGAVSDLQPPPSDATDTQEFHPWNPYKANKDIQVGDFYFKRRNYKAALDRYKEALYYKENDATATFRAGESEEKLGNKAEARKYFEQYLKILPEGPLAKDAHASLAKLEKSH